MRNNRNLNQALTLQEVEILAPSAFQTAPHSSRSSRYGFVSTMEVIKGMLAAGFQIFSASESRTKDDSRRGFVKHMLRFRAQQFMNALRGDVFPEVVLVNAHDGSSRYKLMAGIFRLVCENGAVVADSLVNSVSVMHTGNVVAEVLEASHRIAEQSHNAFDAIEEWSRLQLNSAERYEFARAAHFMRFADADGKIATVITPEQLLVPRREADRGNDLWRTFNTIQENVIKGEVHGVELRDGRRRNVTTRAIRGISQDVKLNQALWLMAENMQRIKAGEPVKPLALAATAGSDVKE